MTSEQLFFIGTVTILILFQVTTNIQFYSQNQELSSIKTEIQELKNELIRPKPELSLQTNKTALGYDAVINIKEKKESECILISESVMPYYSKRTFQCAGKMKICDNKIDGYWSCLVFDTNVRTHDSLDTSLTYEEKQSQSKVKPS